MREPTKHGLWRAEPMLRTQSLMARPEASLDGDMLETLIDHMGGQEVTGKALLQQQDSALLVILAPEDDVSSTLPPFLLTWSILIIIL